MYPGIWGEMWITAKIKPPPSTHIFFVDNLQSRLITRPSQNSVVFIIATACWSLYMCPHYFHVFKSLFVLLDEAFWLT